MTSIFEQLGGTYTEGSDGMLYPNLSVGDREHRPIGKWGRMHRAYLEAEHHGLYDRMILNGTLDRHLADAEERAQAMLEQLTRQMAMQEGITERCFPSAGAACHAHTVPERLQRSCPDLHQSAAGSCAPTPALPAG